MLPSQGCGTVTGAGVREARDKKSREERGPVDQTSQAAWQAGRAVWTGMAVVRRLRLWQLRAPPVDMMGRGIMRCARGYPWPR